MYSLVWIGVLLTLPWTLQANEVPPFTPNVVDPSHVLSDLDVASINGTLKEIRDKADIWGAVLVVDELRDDTVETLAEKAFNTWKLGQTKKDNGLLLVLAMKDRKSRFEVGYGLEGELPDTVARRALDDVLRPFMRQGEYKNAIVQSFLYMARQKAKEATFDGTMEAPLPETSTESNDLADLNVRRGLFGLLTFYLFLWLLRPIAKGRAIALARRLQKVYPAYVLAHDRALNQGKHLRRFAFFGESIGGSVAIRGFLMLNPGIFIFAGAGMADAALAGIAALLAVISVLYYWGSTRRYRSPQAYQEFLARARRENERLVAKGYKREVAPGQYEYTSAWYASDEYRRSRASSSSDSSSSSRSSSSSGGGSSGGGGASSSW